MNLFNLFLSLANYTSSFKAKIHSHKYAFLQVFLYELSMIVSEIYDRPYNPDTIVIVNSEILLYSLLPHYCQNAI